MFKIFIWEVYRRISNAEYFEYSHPLNQNCLKRKLEIIASSDYAENIMDVDKDKLTAILNQ